MEVSNDSEKKARERRIKKEKSRLYRILCVKKSDAPPKLKAAEGLIDHVAFMLIHMQDLQDEINAKGCTEPYQNGENQRGIKKSAAFNAYTSTIKNYMTAIKQLADLAPDGTNTDELDAFLKS